MRKENRGKRVELDFTVTPKQKLFCDTKEPFEVLYGGAAGGGKSYGQLIDALLYALEYPGLRQILFRNSFPELNRTLILNSFNLFPANLCKYNQTNKQWTFFNGSTIDFGYLEKDIDVMIYQGAEYDVIRFDELTHFSTYQYNYMKSRIRGVNDYPKQIKSTSNPGNKGHYWVKGKFITGKQPLKMYKSELTSTVFIPAKVQENDFLMAADPDYVKRLMQLPEQERKALLDGDWDIYEGMSFEKFSPDIHIIDDFEIPQHWYKWRAADNGYTDPFAWYWFAVDEHGTVYIYREFTRSYDDPKLTYTQQAEKVKYMSQFINKETMEFEEERVEYTVVGHDAFAIMPTTRTSSTPQGKSLIDYYEEAGLTGFIKPITDRKLKKAVLVEYLEPYTDHEGIPTAKLKIFKSCKVLIDMIPVQVNDEKDPEKVAETSIDHQVDAISYGLLSYHKTFTQGIKQDLPPIAAHKQKLARVVHFKRRASTL